MLITSGSVEQVEEVSVASYATESTSPGAAAQQPDDYDFWCEPIDVCDRPRGQFISETKANIFYGYSEGTVGSFDVILRTNLNGRQARSTVWVIWDEGPPLYFEYVDVNCFESVLLFPDINCGNHTVGSGVFVGPAGTNRWNSGLTYGNHLANTAEYYSTVSARFRPTGYDTLTFGQLFETPLFNCAGVRARCRFY